LPDRLGLVPLKMLTKPERPAVPITSRPGEKNVRNGGVRRRVAAVPLRPREAAEVWGGSARRGQAKWPDDLSRSEVAAGGMVAVGDDVKGMLDFPRPMFALYRARGRAANFITSS
jgi:hypothetical protein